MERSGGEKQVRGFVHFNRSQNGAGLYHIRGGGACARDILAAEVRVKVDLLFGRYLLLFFFLFSVLDETLFV